MVSIVEHQRKMTFLISVIAANYLNNIFPQWWSVR